MARFGVWPHRRISPEAKTLITQEGLTANEPSSPCPPQTTFLLTERSRYTPYGSPGSTSTNVAGGPSDLTFTGQRDDGALNLLYFGARYYDARIGQFSQPDSILDGLNRYAYVHGKPLSLVDPTGNYACAEASAIAASNTAGICAGPSTSYIANTAIAISRGNSGRTDAYKRYERLVSKEPPLKEKVDNLVTVGGFVPVVGEALDVSYCLSGDRWSCAGIFAPFVGGRFLRRVFRVTPSRLLDNFVDVGGGANLIRRADVDGVPVSIKSGHGYRPDHGSVDITGVLGRDAVDSAVANDLAARVNAGTPVTRAGGGHSTFLTVVDGHTVEYRAVFVPATGRYEVGTYYIP